VSDVGTQQPGCSPRIGQGRVRLLFRKIDAKIVTAIGQRTAPPRKQLGGPPHGAHTSRGADRRSNTQPLVLSKEVGRIKYQVMSDQHAPSNQQGNVGRHVRKSWSLQDIRSADAMDVLRAEVAIGIEQSRPLVQHLTRRV
jgi:hypothetical protein